MDKKGKIQIYTILSVLTIFSILTLAIIYGDVLLPSVFAATSQTTSTVSNATVAVSIGFTFSGNMSDGVLFGDVNTNTNDNNATKNYVANNTAGCGGNCTAYYLTMASTNNANADTCINDNVALTSGANTIPNTGYTYNATSTFYNATSTGANSVAITTTSTLAGTTALAANANQTFRFFLDVPSAQTSGVYNNTLSVKVLQTGVSC